MLFSWIFTFLIVFLLFYGASPNISRIKQRDIRIGKISGGFNEWIDRNSKSLFAAVFLIGIAIRVLFLVLSLKGSVTPEEALIGVQAESFLKSRSDIGGAHLPAYSAGWESMQRGMLLPILSILFLKVFGHTALALRLPMLFMSLLQLWMIAHIIRDTFGKKAGIIVLFFIDFLPWHILSCTYASQTQLILTGFVLGAYCLLKVPQKNGFLYVAAICLAMTLYAGDAAWVPCTVLFLCGVLLLGVKKLVRFKKLALASIIWILIAIPAILTFMINELQMPSFSLLGVTIPRFESWEHSQYFSVFEDTSNLRQNMFEAIYFMLLSIFEDDYAQASMYIPANNGGIYMWCIPVLFAGAAVIYSRLIDQKERENRGFTFAIFAILVMAALLNTCLFGAPDILHMYPLQIAISILSAIGISWLIRRVHFAGALILIVSILSFMPFATEYITGTYVEDHATSLGIGFMQAAREMKQAEVEEYIVTDNFYPHINPGMAAKIEVAFAWDVLPEELDKVKVRHISDEVFEQDGRIRAYILHDNDWENISVEMENYDYSSFGVYTLISPT